MAKVQEAGWILVSYYHERSQIFLLSEYFWKQWHISILTVFWNLKTPQCFVYLSVYLPNLYSCPSHKQVILDDIQQNYMMKPLVSSFRALIESKGYQSWNFIPSLVINSIFPSVHGNHTSLPFIPMCSFNIFRANSVLWFVEILPLI